MQESRKLGPVVSERNAEFLLGNVEFLSSAAERINEMKSQNSGLCSRPFVVKLFSWNGAFREMKGNVLNAFSNIMVKPTAQE